MKQAIMKRWVKALRSGKYKQTRYKLRLRNSRGAAANSFCCLGVLCDLFAQDHPNAGWVSKAGDVPTSSDMCVFSTDKTVQIAAFALTALPDCVQKWAGVKDGAGRIELTKKAAVKAGLVVPSALETCETSLAELNDHNEFNFSQIADVVEKHWRKL